MDKKYKENPNTVIVNSIRGLMEKNGGYCPCQAEKSEDTKCPCKKFREGQGCCCNLYVEDIE